MRLKRSALVGGFLGFGLVLTVGSVAWACTEGVASPSLAPATPNRAPEGSPITVQGTNWEPGPVVIYLGESSPDREVARVAAAAKNPGEKAGFSAEVVVPKVAAGKYYLFAVQGDLASPPATPFEVVTPTGETRSPEPASSGSPPAQGSPNGSPQTALRTSGGSQSPAPSAGPADQSPAPASAPVSSATPPPADRPVRAASPSSPAPATIGAGPVVGRGPALAGAPVEDASLAPPPEPDPAAVTADPAPVAAAPEREAPRPSSAVLAGDLWSGFEGASKNPGNSPSLVNLPAGHDGPGQVLQNGVWFFASGLVALFAGFALADLRRRRAEVVADDRPVAGA